MMTNAEHEALARMYRDMNVRLEYHDPPFDWAALRGGFITGVVLLVALAFCLWAINPDSWQFR